MVRYSCAMPRIGPNDHICRKSVYKAPSAPEPAAPAEVADGPTVSIELPKAPKKTRKASKAKGDA